jgi:hypothetical protein
VTGRGVFQVKEQMPAAAKKASAGIAIWGSIGRERSKRKPTKLCNTSSIRGWMNIGGLNQRAKHSLSPTPTEPLSWSCLEMVATVLWHDKARFGPRPFSEIKSTQAVHPANSAVVGNALDSPLY